MCIGCSAWYTRGFLAQLPVCNTEPFIHSCTKVPVTQRQQRCKLHAVTFNYCNTAAANKPKPDTTTTPRADDTRGCSGCSYTSQGGALPAAAELCCLRLILSSFKPHCYSSGGLYNRHSTGTPSRLPHCARTAYVSTACTASHMAAVPRLRLATASCCLLPPPCLGCTLTLQQCSR